MSIPFSILLVVFRVAGSRGRSQLTLGGGWVHLVEAGLTWWRRAHLVEAGLRETPTCQNDFLLVGFGAVHRPTLISLISDHLICV